MHKLIGNIFTCLAVLSLITITSAAKAHGWHPHPKIEVRVPVPEVVKQVKKTVDRELTTAKKKVDKSATKVKKTVDRELTTAKKKVDKSATKVKKTVDRELTTAKENTERELNVLNEERKEAEKQIKGAIEASVEFSQNQLSSIEYTLGKFKKRIEEGKILDAVYHLGADQLTEGSSNAAKAVQKSPLLNQVATAAASTYGGPTGAAAYAAWLTYETTGDLHAAMRAGALAGASSYVNQNPELSELNISPALKQEIAQFSVNAAAIAASGGSEQDVLDAFKDHANSAVTAEIQTAVQGWVSKEILPKIKDKTEIASAPKNWQEMSVVDKAKKVKASYEQFKEDVKKKVIHKTGIDPSTITLSQKK